MARNLRRVTATLGKQASEKLRGNETSKAYGVGLEPEMRQETSDEILKRSGHQQFGKRT